MADDLQIQPDADVVTDPASVVEEHDETPDAPAPETPKPDSEQPAQPDAPKQDFRDLFKAAQQKAIADPEQAESDEGSDDPAKEAASQESDAKVPDDKAKPTEDEAAKAADDGKRDRGRNYKEVLAENETLRTEAQAAVAKVEDLNSKFEAYGGIDVVSTAMEIYDKLATGNAADVIQNLPPHVRTGVQRQVFEAAITDEANRVFGVNHVLKADFGLAKDIDQPTLEKVFEFTVHRLNEDPQDFIAFIDRELELANTPERELEKLRLENERLKKQPAEGDKPKADTPESEADLRVRIQTTHDEFEQATFDEIIQPELKAYGLEISEKDTQTVRDAKQLLRSMVREYVGVEMRTAKAYEPMLQHWIAGTEATNPWYQQAEGAYKRAMKPKVENVLKAVSKLLTVARSGGGQQKGGAPSVPAPGDRKGIQPSDKGKQGQGGGFSSAWSSAKRSAGS